MKMKFETENHAKGHGYDVMAVMMTITSPRENSIRLTSPRHQSSKKDSNQCMNDVCPRTSIIWDINSNVYQVSHDSAHWHKSIVW